MEDWERKQKHYRKHGFTLVEIADRKRWARKHG